MENTSFLALGPDLALVAAAIAVLGVEVIWKPGHRVWAALVAAGLVVAGAVAIVQWNRTLDAGGTLHFTADTGVGVIDTPMLVMDPFAAFGALVIVAITAVALLGAWDLISQLESRGAEFVALALLSATGLHLMIASANLIMLFLGLEVASISLYVVAGFTRERVDADEAAMKYFLLGSFASAVFLYGVALVFASTGSTSIYGASGFVAFFRGNLVVQPGILLAGIGLMLVGLGFKISAAPFHMWAPDVYQGAPSGAVGFMAAGVKVAGFAALFRVLGVSFETYLDDWAPAVAILAGLSVVVGTTLAIAQTDIKRMLAYSGVAHAGFILTALVAGTDGIPAMWFYVATYAFQLLGAFAVVAVVSGAGSGRSAISDYSGLAARAPWLAGTLMLMMLAMGGIPLTAGFVGKAAVFTAAIDAGYLWLAVLALVAAVAGLFFYLRIVVVMYMQAPEVVLGPGAATAAPQPSSGAQAVLAVSVAVTLFFGIVPWPLLNLVGDALPL